MKEDKLKRGIAPTEIGELPNELRCKRCFTLLSKLEDSTGKMKLWCYKCGTQSAR